MTRFEKKDLPPITEYRLQRDESHTPFAMPDLNGRLRFVLGAGNKRVLDHRSTPNPDRVTKLPAMNVIDFKPNDVQIAAARQEMNRSQSAAQTLGETAMTASSELATLAA